MPLVHNAPLDLSGRIGIWEIAESLDFFNSKLLLTPREKEEYLKIKFEHKSLEWWASRYLTMLLHQKEIRDPIIKDEQGKPFFEQSKRFLSLSHTDGYVASCFHDKPCGIDIQVYDEKTLTVAPRILSSVEMRKFLPQSDLHMATFYWSAKEAVYKAYGKRKLEFRREIRLESFKREAKHIFGKISIAKGKTHLNYEINGYLKKKYLVVTAIQN